MKWRWWLAAALVAVAVLASWMVVSRLSTGTTTITLRPDDAEVTARGQRVYMAHCAACHGARLEGQPNWRERDAQGRLPAPPHDASGHTWHHPDDMLFDLTKYGIAKVIKQPDYASAMPAYEGVLADAEIVAALSWIKAQWPSAIRAKHDEINRASRARR